MYSLLHHNTFGIDAWCRDFQEYSSIDELRKLLPLLKEQRWLHIGGGSNLLFVNDFKGLILHSGILGCEEIRRTDSHVWLRVGAGMDWDDFVAYCVEHGYYGLENLSLIPGEVGASAVQNIGAYGVEAGQYIEQVETLDSESGETRIFQSNECKYAYRSSVFKHEYLGRYIVTHVVYRLSLDFQPNLHYAALTRELQARQITPETLTAKMLRNIIVEVRHSKLPDPNELGSAGSFFMNPVISKEQFVSLQQKYADIPHYDMGDAVKIPAGWLIERCGWKGQSLGPAGVYAKQALVIVNLGGATGEDIVNLSNAVQRDVREKFGIDIHPEVNFIL